jgi:hypothetical protein
VLTQTTRHLAAYNLRPPFSTICYHNLHVGKAKGPRLKFEYAFGFSISDFQRFSFPSAREMARPISPGSLCLSTCKRNLICCQT